MMQHAPIPIITNLNIWLWLKQEQKNGSAVIRTFLEEAWFASMTCHFSYPLVNVYITMERSTIFNGKTHYFYGHFQ